MHNLCYLLAVQLELEASQGGVECYSLQRIEQKHVGSFEFLWANAVVVFLIAHHALAPVAPRSC